MRKLNERLQAIVRYIEKGERVADIGTDHALLPVYLVRNGISPLVIATDVAAGPFAVARGRIDTLMDGSEGAERIILRRGDGLEALEPGEVDAVIIAGMGGELIADIITRDTGKGRSFAKYILQPRTKADRLRVSLAENGFIIREETAALERGRVCEVLVAGPG
ncbi:MAG: class I SAM-dependent methyltransferase [Clostridiales Family XIII bacterium]|nr:class I SAM-dependent methyltransferase [Clostridiales Family XIII bacterium]